MGFLDSVRDAIKGVVTSSKDQAARKDDVVVDQGDATPVPPTVPVVEPAQTQGVEDAREAKQPTFETYTVRTGDSLSEIGARFGVSRLEIAELNNIENPDLIFPGQVFRIPTS